MSASETFSIRRALPTDAPAINRVIERVWSEKSKQDDHLAAVINEPDHRTHVAEIDGVVCGFVDGFVTLTEQGSRRWEVDLLAVDPDFQRRGIAAALVEANVNTSQDFFAQEWRSLIHVDNIASQRTFRRCGFHPEPSIYSLYVADGLQTAPASSVKDAYFIPVMTLTYRGLWIEGNQNAGALTTARDIVHRMKFDTAGALIPIAAQLLESPESLGYSHIAQYQFFHR